MGWKLHRYQKVSARPHSRLRESNHCHQLREETPQDPGQKDHFKL